MKMKVFFLLSSLTLLGNLLYSQTNQQKSCTITCNLTTTYVCPNSNTWKNNPDNIYDDVELMQEIGYTKDNKGCWVSNGSKIVTVKGKPIEKMKNWFGKLKKYFSTTKSGF